mgnify:CR=1 FL=1
MVKGESTYTEEMDNYIKENYQNYPRNEFTKMFNKKFNTNRSVGAISSRAWSFGITTKIAEKRKKIYIGFNIDEIKRRAIRKKINGYKVKKFYKNFVLYEKTLENGETLRKTYTYWDLSRIV